jgi:prepilin-type N-terminal cleavage/methylation domain-containing protein
MKRGVTLIELLMVMAIMGILLGMSLPMFMDMGRESAMRVARRNVRASLGHARQYAVTHRQRVTWVCGTNWYAIRDNAGEPLSNTNWLPAGVSIVTTAAVEFALDGRARLVPAPVLDTFSWDFEFTEPARGTNGVTNVVTLNLLTGTT